MFIWFLFFQKVSCQPLVISCWLKRIIHHRDIFNSNCPSVTDLSSCLVSFQMDDVTKKLFYALKTFHFLQFIFYLFLSFCLITKWMSQWAHTITKCKPWLNKFWTEYNWWRFMINCSIKQMVSFGSVIRDVVASLKNEWMIKTLQVSSHFSSWLLAYMPILPIYLLQKAQKKSL